MTVKKGRIIGTGSSVPDQRLTNEDLEQMVDTSNEWILERTGIHERRIVDSDTAASDLALEASREALDAAEVEPEELDLIIVGTITPDNVFPTASCHLQRKLGAGEVGAFDVSAACSGFLYALTTGDRFAASEQYDRILVVGVDVLSSIVDYTDRSSCILFGDAAGAVVMEPSEEERGVLYSNLYAKGDEKELLIVPAGGSRLPASQDTVEQNQHCIHMEGRRVYRFAVSKLVEMVREAVENGPASMDEISLVVPHQVNQRIIDAAGKRLDLDSDRLFSNIAEYGNTSAGSVPLALDEAVRTGQVNAGDYIILCAMGAGLSWGTTLLRWG